MMGSFGVIVMLTFAVQTYANEADDLMDRLNSEEGMNMFVDKLTNKLTNRALQTPELQQEALDDKAMDGTTLGKPSRADLIKQAQSAEANATQAHAARKAAEANTTQFAQKLANAQSAQKAAEAKATQMEQELTKAQSAQKAAEAKAAQEAQEVVKAQSAQQTAEAKASQDEQELTKAQDAQQTAEAKASQEATELTKAQSAQKAAEAKATQETQTASKESSSEKSVDAQDSQVNLVVKSAKTSKAKEDSEAQASVITAGEAGIALMAQDAVQPSVQYLPFAMASIMFSFVLVTTIYSRPRNMPSFQDASAGLLPATAPMHCVSAGLLPVTEP